MDSGLSDMEGEALPLPAEVEAAVEQRVATPEGLAEMVGQYREKFGNQLNTDDARSLFPEYEASKERRALFAPAVQEPASAIVKEAYSQMLADPTIGNQVVFTGGGGGSGKGTAIGDVPEAAEKFNNADIVYDTTLSGYDSSVKKIDQALAAGKDVSLLYVHRPVELAAEGALNRSVGSGRAVPIDIIGTDHYKSQRTMLELADHYKDDPRVSTMVIDNSGRRQDVALGSLDLIRNNLYESRESAIARATDGVEVGYLERLDQGKETPDYALRGILGEARTQQFLNEVGITQERQMSGAAIDTGIADDRQPGPDAGKTPAGKEPDDRDAIALAARERLEERGVDPGDIREDDAPERGTRTGKVLAMGEDHIALSSGRGGFMMIERDKLDQDVKIGQNVSLTFGEDQTQVRSKGLGQDRGAALAGR